MKNVKFNSFIILLISSVFIYLLLKDNFKESMDLLSRANLWWILLALVLFFAYIYFEAMAMHTLVKGHNIKYSKWKMLRLQIMTKFFNGITPFSSGGQPLQVYEFKKGGVDAACATGIIVEYFILFQVAIVFMGIIAVIVNAAFDLYKYVRVLRYFVLFGFFANLFLLLVAIFASINAERNIKVATKINNFLYKCKLIKNKDKYQKKLEKFFNDYYEGFSKIKNNYKLMAKVIGLIIISMSMLFIIPQCIFNALRIPHHLNVFTTIITGIYIFIMGSFVPTPGGAGGLEMGFVSFFANFVPKGLLPPALIVWRFLTFYFPVLAGGIVYNMFGEKADKKKELKKQKK